MPRIDPMKLLVCLSVLLAPNGGIRTAAEVKRLANLMAKFSKKLVSKCIYIQILKCTETDLLGQFMQTGGWALVHMWLVDGIGSKNWPLIQELLELLLCCPVDVERLKINSTPRLVKSLSTDSAHESVRLLATKLVEQWLSIVKAPKQPSSMATTSQGPSEMSGTSNSSLVAISDGKSSAADQQAAVGVGGGSQEGSKNGLLAANSVAESHQKSNGYTDNSERNAENGEDDEGEDHHDERNHHGSADDVDTAKKTFRAIVEHQDQPSHKKTSLVLKITTKNGKQVVAKVVTPSGKKSKCDEEEEDDEDEEEVLVNIESDKHPDEAPMEQVSKESKKLDAGDHHSSKEGSKERSSSSSSKDKDRHHRDHREKDRKSGSSSSSSGSRSSSSKSSSSGGGGNNSSSSSSSKHKSSSSSSKSSSSSSSSSRDKDKERHGSSSSTSSSSKHKSSSSSSASKSNGSSSKSGSSSSSSDKHRERSSHSTGNKDSKDSKGHSSSPNSSHNSSSGKHSAKLSRKNSKDEGNDSGSESSSNTTAGGPKSASPASGGGSSTSIPSKKASISIEVRNPENRPKTVKTYNSQFRSHGLIEEAPPPPSRKGLKKPSSSSTSSASSTAATSSASVGLTASGTATKRSTSPPPSSGKEAVAPPEKKLKEDPPERPGSIKLIPPKRQHALVESDMFMDALSATLRKDVKKRKRRTSGSENPAPTSKPDGNVGKSDGAGTTTAKTAPESPTRRTSGETAAGVTKATTPTTPTSPKPIVPTIAPMSFYRDTLAEEDENKDGEGGKGADTEGGKAVDGQEDKRKEDDDGKERDTVATAGEKEDDEDDEAIVKKPKRVRCELNDDEEDDGVEDGEKKKKKPEEGDATEDTDKTELMDVVMNDVEKKMAEEAEGGEGGSAEKDDEDASTGKKPPGPGCGPDGPPGVLVIHRRKGPKKQLRWRVADELEEIRYFELDVTERCNVTKSFTDMKQMERVDERQKFLMARKVGSEDIMVEKTPWRPLIPVDNVPASPDGSQSVERNVQQQRERGCLQALYFNKHMIPDSPVEPEPADINQTADPVHIPLEDVTGNPDSVNDFTSMPWPDPKSTPPHESAAFNSSFYPADLPPGGGFGPGGFPPPFPPGAAGAIGNGPAPWNMHARPGVLQPGLFPLNQPPPGMAAVGGAVGGGGGGGGGGSPNMLSLPPPGLFPGATNFNAPPPDLALMGDVGGRRPPGASGDRGADFRSGPPPPQQWVTNNGRPYGGGANNQRGGAPGFGNRGGGPGNWNRSAGSTGDRGRNGEEGRGNYRGHWMQNNSNRGHNNNRGSSGRKW